MIKRQIANWLQRFGLLRWGLRLGVHLFMPRQHVGAVGVLFNQTGQVLLVEHVFRPLFPWGLPGGWVGRGEDPAQAVEREFKEELGLDITVRTLLLCEPQGGRSGVPRGLGLAYYCRLVDGEFTADQPAQAYTTYEVLSVEWLDPDQVPWNLTAIDCQAIALAKNEFEREQISKNEGN